MGQTANLNSNVSLLPMQQTLLILSIKISRIEYFQWHIQIVFTFLCRHNENDFCIVLHIFSLSLLNSTFYILNYPLFFIKVKFNVHFLSRYDNVPVLSRWDWRSGPPPPAVGCWPGAGGRRRCPPAWSGGGSVAPPNQCYGTLEPSPHWRKHMIFTSKYRDFI